MTNTVAGAGAAGDMGAGLGLVPELRYPATLKGAWGVTCYSGTGWRGALTQIRKAGHAIADRLGCGANHWLRRVSDFVSRPALKWTDKIENIVVNAGLDYLLDAGLSGGTQITTWYAGLTDGTPTVAAGDTAASHAGWTEVTAYDEAVRQTWTDGGVSSQSVDNSASKAVFTCDTNSTTVGGAFLISDSTKGGTSGTLYAAGAFTGGDKALDDNDVLNVTATFTGAAA